MTENITKFLNERYFLSEEKTWEDLAIRVSNIYPNIKESIKNKIFIPSSPTLMNANTNGKRKGTLSSCFTMNIEDSIEGIFDALKEGALVTKASGGVGYVFSTLRGSNEEINTLKRNSSGPIPFMMNFNTMLDSIQQGGVRRGAGMAQFDIDHPNILEVIKLKNTEGILERLNISIRITDNFYKKLKENPNNYHEVKSKNGDIYPLKENNKLITVKEVWDEIINSAWKSAEPGIFNIDIAYKQCTVTNLDNIVLSNPCAEYVSIPYSSCNLGSLNLIKFVKEDKTFDFDLFEKEIRLATRFLDSVIDINDYPLDKIKETTLKIRPIGLGAMSLGNALYKMRIPYNSIESHKLIYDIFLKLTLISMDESINIAKEKGKSYPAFDYNLFIKANERLIGNRDDIKDKIKKYGIRNSCFTSIAPNGSISYIAGMLSGGIEPVYALVFTRKIEKLNKDYETIYIVDPTFDEYLKENYSEEKRIIILEKISKNNGSCKDIEEIPYKDRKVFITATDLSPMEHLEVLSIVAKNISLSVSKTINMPNSATKEEISDIYMKAHELGIIGVTVFRDGCRKGILNSSQHEETIIKDSNAPKRPKKLEAHLYPISVKGNKFGVIVGVLQNRPYEVFAFHDGNIIKNSNGFLIKESKGKYNYVCDEYGIENIQLSGEAERAVTILASQLLRHGVPIKHIINTIKKISDNVTDFTTAVARVLSKYIVNGDETGEICPDCKNKIIYDNGCKRCVTCGWSGCN